MAKKVPATSGRLEQWRGEPNTSVLIIGGGINGIAVFRELALNGVDVTLVEKKDYCSGASAASSHMIHGGIRYLENGEFRLVRESLRERNRLLKNAPHYVKPLKTVIPIFSFFSGLLTAPFRFLLHRSGKPKERGALLIKLGLMLYDTFGRDGGAMPRHRFVGRKQTLKQLPGVNRSVKYSAHYFDAAIENPERLAIDMLLDVLDSSSHARALNYVSAHRFDAGEVVLRDELTRDELSVRPSLVINASGPWTDETNQSLGIPSRYMGGTKGSHIVLDNPELLRACDSREVFFENHDGRIVLMYPLLGRVLVGTTDIPVDNPDDVECTDEEVDYFFSLVQHVFPNIALDRSQIVYRYSGVRPLPAAGDVNPGVISRDYRIVEDSLGDIPLLSLVGGKWTTFRAIGEHLADRALSFIGRPRITSTASLKIGGGKDFPMTPEEMDSWLASQESGSPRARELLIRYGTRATELLRKLGDSPETHLTNVPGFSREEIAYLVSREQVMCLSDLVLRRTTLGFRGDLGATGVKELAEVVGAELGWDKPRTSTEQRSIRIEQRQSAPLGNAAMSS